MLKNNIMGKVRVGNKKNSFLNKTWSKHAKCENKKIANSRRRMYDKIKVNEGINEIIDTSPINQ